MKVQPFVVRLKDLPYELPYEVINGTRYDWEPFAVESYPGAGNVWIWARLR